MHMFARNYSLLALFPVLWWPARLLPSPEVDSAFPRCVNSTLSKEEHAHNPFHRCRLLHLV